jgi:hypothetical protein
MKEKIINFLEKLNYWHWWNKKLFEKKIEALWNAFKILNERTYNTSIAFRKAYGTIIWWTIAFLWLLSNNKDFPNDIKFYLLQFIVFWIIWLLFSYLIDFFILSYSTEYVNKKQQEFIAYKNKIIKFDFWKKEFEESNKAIKFKMPWSSIFVKFIYTIFYLLLFFTLAMLIIALIKILQNYDKLI